MKACLCCLFILALPVLACAQLINFDNQQPGNPPQGWTVAMTHTGGAPKWEIVKDPTAPSSPNVLGQTSNDRTGGRFPLAVFDKANFVNGTVSVRFKAISGEADQAAGIVWRYENPDNYYIVRANALEDNVVLYKVQAGKRLSLAPIGTASSTYGVKQRVPSKTWNELSVSFQGSRFKVSFNGKQLFEVEDSTFSNPGKVGLWTKADSVTYFDDFKSEPR
jgi:hypothetical protein